MSTIHLDSLLAERHLLIGLTISLLAVASLCCVAHGFSRIFLFRSLRWTDWTLAFAQGALILLAVVSLSLSFTPVKSVDASAWNQAMSVDMLVNYVTACSALTLVLAKLSLWTVLNSITTSRIAILASRTSIIACFLAGLAFLIFTGYTCPNCAYPSHAYQAISTLFYSLDAVSALLLIIIAALHLHRRLPSLSLCRKVLAIALLLLSTLFLTCPILQLRDALQTPITPVRTLKWSILCPSMAVTIVSLASLLLDHHIPTPAAEEHTCPDGPHMCTVHIADPGNLLSRDYIADPGRLLLRDRIADPGGLLTRVDSRDGRFARGQEGEVKRPRAVWMV
ncbi:hypothetical protein K461DRAFT_314498 [Myriangium duriaei CBS 260.36]|uniref:Integral membrane protein n=1 Tax=Myriangium duriaei CBS 260.36 TaxID=1168546 RepID=A0A9P4IXQ3_9PEZI|nr:hypothetical protein K461DRAFT_314498 [Myriangium duriaei CBS 260.36]